MDSSPTNRGAIELQAAITARKLTREAVAAQLGLEKATGQITRLCNGERKPGRSLAFAIEREFGVPMSAWEIEVIERTPAAAPKVA
jgi:transcriptional regulator with XRE-family HTH domain